MSFVIAAPEFMMAAAAGPAIGQRSAAYSMVLAGRSILCRRNTAGPERRSDRGTSQMAVVVAVPSRTFASK